MRADSAFYAALPFTEGHHLQQDTIYCRTPFTKEYHLLQDSILYRQPFTVGKHTTPFIVGHHLQQDTIYIGTPFTVGHHLQQESIYSRPTFTVQATMYSRPIFTVRHYSIQATIYSKAPFTVQASCLFVHSISASTYRLWASPLIFTMIRKILHFYINTPSCHTATEIMQQHIMPLKIITFSFLYFVTKIQRILKPQLETLIAIKN